MEDVENNVAPEQVAPVAEDAPDTAVDTTEEVSDSPEEPAADKEEKILGKFNTADDLAKSYQEAERQLTRLRQGMNDPQFVYEQAKRLGLTDEQAQAQAQGTAAPAAAPVDVNAQVQFALKVEKSKELYPELESNTKYQTLVSALMNDPESDTYMDPVASAKALFSEIRKVEKKAEVSGAVRAKTTVSEKERASTASVTSSTDSNAEEEADLARRMKSLNPKTQQAAMVEHLMRRNKQQ